MKSKTFKMGGIHVPEHKHTPADHIITVELPMTVDVCTKQHIGAPAAPIVKKGDVVVRGQKIAEARGKVSAPVHSPISGTVTAIGPVRNTSGIFEEAITIKATEEQHQADEQARKEKPQAHDFASMKPEDIIAAISEAGIVGLGGATFPTAMKLSPPPGSKSSLLIINAAECEPYLTCDDALMRAYPKEIVEGIRIMLYASSTPKAVIAIEDNKPQAFAALTAAAEPYPEISVQLMKAKYPQGGEKQLINTITGFEVKSGALPISVGVIVQNVGTAYAVYKAVALKIPLIERILTVAGKGNYLVPIGMNLQQLPIDTEGEQIEEADVVIGGPMMGRSAATLNAPVQKGTAGITILKAEKFDPQPCIRCAECVKACPMGLEPYLLSTYGRLERIAEAAAIGAMDCIECGSCSYSCPSARPILDYIRLAKGLIRKRPSVN